MKVYELTDAVNAIAPWSTCASWDNSGFLVGRKDDEIKKVYVCLDVVSSTVDDAVKHGCNVILAHHPVIFSGLKRITADDFTGSLLLKIIENKINVVAAHTNFDMADQGVNYVLCKELGLENIRKMNEDDENPSFIGFLTKETSGKDLSEKIKKVLGLDVIRACGLDLNKDYKVVAVCGGAGTDLWQSAVEAGADVLVSADGKHHVGLEAEAAGIAVFDGNHFHTENLSMKYLATGLKEIMQNVEVVLSDIDTCPWKNY